MPLLPPETKLKRAARLVLAAAMVWIGVLHFVRPEGFVRIVPSFLPAPLALVYVSGFFEIAGGLGLLVARVHRAAAWGLIALYVAVFPANVNMAINDIPLGADRIPTALLWLRLPFQALFIAWAYWLGRSGRTR
ncbi:MAG: DoxX family membrane protein [Labilithrix sp.]|nr:DoxX family membrane protein [Labilithrix sp.]